MAAHLLRHSLSPQPGISFSYSRRNHYIPGVNFISPLPVERHHSFRRRSNLRPPNFVVFSSLETRIDSAETKSLEQEEKSKDSPILLDVSGMMCGGCVSRVKNILSADERVDSVVVNMLTETAAVKLNKLDVASANVK